MQFCPVEVAQHEWEFDILLDLYKRVKPKVVLEIGAWKGGTLYHWLKEADWPVMVVTIDSVQAKESELWNSWVSKGKNQRLLSMWGYSSGQNILFAVKNIVGEIDWLFLDGDHSKEGITADFNNYFPMLNDGGYCVFHDIVGENGVRAVWNEAKVGRRSIEICHSNNELGIGVIQRNKSNENT